MPDGVVKWFDEKTGEGRIVHGGRHYTAGDVPPDARGAGTRVHFDVGPDGATAVRVVARGGHPGRRRVARPQGMGPYSVRARRGTTPSPADNDVRRIVRLDPVAVARWWATSVATGYLDDAVATYAPSAEVRCKGRRAEGAAEIERLLEDLPICRSERRPDRITSTAGDVRVEWWPVGGDAALDVRMVVEHGEIVDQEIAEHLAEPDSVGTTGLPFRVEVIRRGRIPPGSVELAGEKVSRAAELSGATVTAARVKLRRLRDPAARRPAIAEATLDLDGEIVRAHASADEMNDAIDLMGHRLEDRLRHRRERLGWVRPTLVEPEPGEWRHGNRATPRTAGFDRPVEEREVVRHKTWAGDALTVDEAAFDLELLDHDFHLFTDLATGTDSLLEASTDGYLLTQLAGASEAALDGAVSEVRIDSTTPPTLGLQAAIERLDLTGELRLFFEDAATHRGHVVYRRLDGHYGLITPET